jgi:hypothetical protein
MIVTKYNGQWIQDFGDGRAFTMAEDGYCDVYFARVINGATANNLTFKPMVTFQGVDETFEPYTSSTLSLPISTYFPTGMKRAGNVYDELTESKAITRIGSITLDGTQTTTFEDLSAYRVGYEVPNMMPSTGSSSTIDDGIISNYLPNASNEITYAGKPGIHRRANGTRQIIVGFGQSSGLDTLAEINEYLSAHPLVVYYPLATETETPITTEDANEALSLLMGKSVSSDNAKQMIDIITKGE